MPQTSFLRFFPVCKNVNGIEKYYDILARLIVLNVRSGVYLRIIQFVRKQNAILYIETNMGVIRKSQHGVV